MVNKQARSPGEIQRFNAVGQVSGDVPSFAADTGAAFRTLEAVGAQLSGHLFKLAGEAAGRAGEMAGLQSQQTGVAYLQARAAEAKGAGIATGTSAATSGTNIAGDKGKWLIERLMADTGLSRAAAAGFAGNLHFESGGFKTLQEAKPMVPGSRGGFGWAQWTGPRRRQFEAWAQEKNLNPSSDEANYGFLLHELKSTSEGTVLDKLRGVEDPDQAALIVSRSFLRPGIPHEDRRVALARQYAQAGPGETALPTQPLALRRDGTIYGEAYDKAAMSAYAWRLDQGISNDLNAAHDQFRDDPAGFQQRVGEIRNTYLQDESFADPQAREVFEKSFASRTETYARDVANRQGQRLDAEQKASAAEALDARLNGIEKDAYLLGANPDGDRIIGQQVDRVMGSIDAAVAQGSVTPAQAATWRKQVKTGTMQSRLNGVFDALETPEEKQQFALGLMTDEKLLSEFGFSDVRAISDQLFNRALSTATRKTAAERIEGSRLEGLIEDDLTSLQATGAGLDPAESGLSADLVSGKLGTEKLVAWQEDRRRATLVYQATAGMEGQSEGDIITRLATIKPKPGQAGYAEQQAVYELAQKQAEQVIKERQQDPLGQATRAGAVDVQPLDFSSAEGLTTSIAERRSAARGVADLYGTPRRFLMPGEQEKLAAELEANPMLMQTISSAAVKSLGPDAPAFLSEISEAAPVLAHASGMASATGDTSLASDIAMTLAAKRDKIYTAKMPPDGDMRMAAQEHLGTALSSLPKTQSALLATATLLFEQAANREGFDTKEITDRGTPAYKAWQSALDRASGRRVLGGTQYGGIAEMNGQSFVAPPDMPTDEPERLWRALDDQLMTLLPPMQSANGVPITARRIRRGRLVTAGDGLYRVALGDPQSENPQWLSTPDGRFWQVDIRELARIEAAR